MRGEGWGVGARNRFSLRGPSWEGRRPSVCSARVIAARGWDRARRETPGVKVGGEGWITQLGAGRGGGRGPEPAGRPPPPGVSIPEQWPLVFPRTGGGSARRRGGGVRREGSPSVVTPTLAPFLGRALGRPAAHLGRGRGAQTKGACAFKAGSPRAGGEGTSGSGVEGGCAGQQGGGAGRAGGGRRGGRPGRARTEQDRGTAARPAGARGGGGAGAPGRRRPWPAGEARPGSGQRAFGAAGALPPGSRSFWWGARAGMGILESVWGEARGHRGWPRAVWAEVRARGSWPSVAAARVPPPSRANSRLARTPTPGKGVHCGLRCPEVFAVGRASKFGVECDYVSGKERQPRPREGRISLQESPSSPRRPWE